MRRMTTTTDTVNTAPDTTSTGTGKSGWEKVHTSVMAAMAAIVAPSISRLNFDTPMPRLNADADSASRFAMAPPECHRN